MIFSVIGRDGHQALSFAARAYLRLYGALCSGYQELECASIPAGGLGLCVPLCLHTNLARVYLYTSILEEHNNRLGILGLRLCASRLHTTKTCTSIEAHTGSLREEVYLPPRSPLLECGVCPHTKER